MHLRHNSQTLLAVIQKQESTQHTVLRIATSCSLFTPATHIHEKTNVLRIEPHMDMESTQVYASTSGP